MSSRSGQGKDSRNILVHNDQIAAAVSVIDPIHRRVHLGQYYTFSTGISSIAFFGTKVLRINADGFSGPFHMTVRAALGGLAEGRLEIYENCTFTETGAEVQAVRHNRSNVDPLPNLTFDNGATFASGTKIFDTLVPAAHLFETKEWVLDGTDLANPEFAVILTNFNSGGAVNGSMCVDWYPEVQAQPIIS